MIQRYGFFGVIKLAFDRIVTFFIFKNARIIRRPFDLRGKNKISVGRGLTTGRYCRIEAHGVNNKYSLIIGRDCEINDSVHIAAAGSVKLGDNVLIASRVFITDLNHGSYKGDLHSHPDIICNKRTLHVEPVDIGSNVWLGEGVVVLPGVTIGSSSIIGANSVVSRNIPANSIAVGNPAKVIKIFDFTLNKWVSVDG
jgi:acetyltransferase-like isoleucine patch superfamily enzyme